MSEIKQQTRARIERGSGSLGAYVHDFDLAGPLDADEQEFVRGTIREHHVVCFRGQDLTPEQHLAFTRVLGEFYIQPVVNGLEGYPETVEVFGAAKLTEGWHQDSTHSERPPRFSILVARTLPPFGNDTEFSSQHKAYDALSEGMKRLLEGLRAVHTTAQVTMSSDARYKDYGRVYEEATQPVVRTHPETGRKGLYLNAMYGRRFEDMTVEESRGLFDFLCTHAGRPEFTFRHRWQPGDVLIWDNASVQHRVIGDMPEGTGRYLHRTTTIGERPY